MFFSFLDSRWIFVGINAEAGRFYPFAHQELNFLSMLPFSNFQSAARICFGFNAIIFIFMFSAIFALISRVFSAKIALFSCVIIFLNLGFVPIITGICFPEKLQSAILVGFVVSAYFIFVRDSHSKFLAILCAFLGVISLFFKETDFIFIGGFSVSWVILALIYQREFSLNGFKNLATNKRAIALTLAFCAFCFIAFYALFILPNVSKSYTSTHGARGILFLKDMANAFLNHPFIFILLPILGIYRANEVCKVIKLGAKIEARFAFFDALLLGALAYGFAYFALKLFSSYYFFPCYVMGFLPCVAYLARYKVKFALIFTLILHFLINVPLALSAYTTTKIAPPHYIKATQFLANYTRESPTNIFLLGQNRDADGLMFYDFLGQFITFFGGENFDLKTNKANPKNAKIADKSAPYSIFNSLEVSAPKSGDLLFLDLNSKDFVNSAYLADLKAQNELIFASQYAGFYNLNAKSILKFLAQNSAFMNFYARQERVSSNIFRAPLGVFIYKVR